MAEEDLNTGEGEGNGTADWRAGLGEELAANPALQDITDVQGLAQNFVDQSAYLGTAIRPPGPEASEADRQKFYSRIQEAAPNLIPRPDPEDPEAMNALKDALGRPADAKGYTMPEIDGLDSERFGVAAPVFHDLGLTQEQVDGLTNWDMAMRAEGVASGKAEITAARAELQREWGVTFEPRSAEIQNFMQNTDAPPGLVEAMGDGSVDNATMRWLHGLVKAVGGEGQTITNQQGGASDGLTPVEAKSRAGEITDRLIKMHPSDPEYKILQDKRIDYLRMSAAA